MNARRFCLCVLVFALSLSTVSAPRAVAQQRAETIDESMRFAREFLRAFYPEFNGKNYIFNFETYARYDDPVNRDNRIFLVDIGEGPKNQVLKCCLGGTVGPLIHFPLPYSWPWGPTPLPPDPPLPPKVRTERPLNVDSRGAIHPYQFLSAYFEFDSGGGLVFFAVPAWSDTGAGSKFYDTLRDHPDATDEELIAAYKESGAKYPLGDREAFKRDLPLNKLEQFLGKLKLVTTKFDASSAERLDELGGFSFCTVLLKTGGKNDSPEEYEASFGSDQGKLLELRRVTKTK